MDWYAFVLGVAIIANTVIGLTVLALGPRRSFNRFFAIVMLGFALWGLGVYIARYSGGMSAAVIGMDIASIGWCFVGTLYLHFILLVTGRGSFFSNRWSYVLFYLTPTVLLLLTWFTDFTRKTEGIGIGNFRPTPGYVLSHLIQAYTISMFVISLVLLFFYWRSSGMHFGKKHEAYFFVICTVISVTAAGTEVVLPIFGIYTFDVPIFIAVGIIPLIAYGLYTRGFVVSLETALGEAITRILHDPLILMDYKGTIERANSAAERLTGYSEKEMKKTPLNKIFDIRGVDFSSGKLEETPFESKELGRCITRDGERVPIEAGWATLYYGGLLAGMVLVVHDMRNAFELIQAEEKARVATVEVKAQRKLTDNLREIINLAAHELRHPAAAIKGSTMLLGDFLSREEDPSVKTALEGMEASADRLARLANELSDMAYVERGELQLYFSETSPAQLIHRAVENVKATRTRARILVDKDGDGKGFQADADKIEEVLSILIDNAVKFSPEGSEVNVWWEQNENGTAFYIADRGLGVSSEHRERIFDRFYEVGGALGHSLPGLGLGLYIAKMFVDSHGGEIAVEAREGGGSIFSFSIPAALPAENRCAPGRSHRN